MPVTQVQQLIRKCHICLCEDQWVQPQWDSFLNGRASARRNEEREKSSLEHCCPERHWFLSWAFTAIPVGLPDVQEAWTTTPALTLTFPEWEKGPPKRSFFSPTFLFWKISKVQKSWKNSNDLFSPQNQLGNTLVIQKRRKNAIKDTLVIYWPLRINILWIFLHLCKCTGF